MPIHDHYQHFADLQALENEGKDYTRLAIDRRSPLAIVAPHGGGIEPGTSELALGLAGQELSLYLFEGLKPEGDTSLHITSYRFDDPLCLALVERAQRVVTVHGCVGQSGHVHVGGLDAALKETIITQLTGAGFLAREDDSHHPGRHHRNLCNRGWARMGVQLELDERLRRAMFDGLSRRDRQRTTPVFDRFVNVLRAVFLDGLSGPKESPASR